MDNIVKVCKVCGGLKQLVYFVKHKECKDGYSNWCKECKLLLQRRAREQKNNSYTKKYEKSVNGFLMRAYRNMLSRVNGIQPKCAHIYIDLPIIPKHDFYAWAKSDKFYALFRNWEKSNYSRKLTPSVDRIDAKMGYTLDNIQWLTHSENSRKTSKNIL